MSEYKRCPRCGEVKPLEEYYQHRGKPDGRQRECQACRVTSSRIARRRAGIRPRRTYPVLRDREWMQEKLLRRLLTADEIAALIGCRPDTVRSAARDLGISIPPASVRQALRAGQGMQT